mgnify:CR=1 FL=1
MFLKKVCTDTNVRTKNVINVVAEGFSDESKNNFTTLDTIQSICIRKKTYSQRVGFLQLKGI